MLVQGHVIRKRPGPDLPANGKSTTTLHCCSLAYINGETVFDL